MMVMGVDGQLTMSGSERRTLDYGQKWSESRQLSGLEMKFKTHEFAFLLALKKLIIFL